MLLVGDEEVFAQTAAALQDQGRRVRLATTGEKAVAALPSFRPDVLIAQVELPGISGLAVIEAARSHPKLAGKVQSIAVTSNHEPAAALLAFEKGADDFLARPFDPREACARVEVLLRRASRLPDPERIESAGLVLEPGARQALVNGAPLRLTRAEFLILHLFVQKAGRVLSRDYILQCLWGAPHPGPTRTVDMHVANLRRKLGPQAKRLETVPGLGYLFGKEGG